MVNNGSAFILEYRVMILPSLVSLFCGYTNPISARRYMKFYYLWSLAMILLLPLPSSFYFYSLFCFFPGVASLSLSGTFVSHAFIRVVASIVLVIVIELPLMFCLYSFGRWFSNKTGNIHRF
jgi:hypothetical protein